MAQVRLYRREDQMALEAICHATALLGDPLPAGAADPEAFAALFIRPYLHLEPSTVWVGEEGGEVVGYLTGVAAPYFALRSLPYRIKAFFRLLTGRLRRRNDGHLVRWLFTRSWREDPPVPPGAYAHFHFNLRKGYRGEGLGRTCLEKFEAVARARGIETIYAKAFCRVGEDDEAVWEALGFRAYQRRRTALFSPYLQTELDWVTFQKTV